MGISLLLDGCRRLGCASALMIASLSYAQTTAEIVQTTPEAITPSASAYASAFKGYKPYTDEPIANWKAANDTTASVGGWREYARQAQQPDNSPKSSAPSSATSTAKPEQAMPSPGEKAKP